jgi:phytoene synthase
MLLNRLLPVGPETVRTDVDSEAQALEACRITFRHAARSLSLIPTIIPQPLRDDIAVLHGLCRLLDDTVDEGTDPFHRVVELARLESELLGERPARPLVALARDRLPRLGIDSGLFEYLFAGVRRDLAFLPLRDDNELLEYSYNVAGVISVMMCAALGVERRRAAPFAVDLGIALQITNIVRDWPADAERGRCYIPARRLAHYELTPDRVVERRADAELGRQMRPVLEGLLRLGDQYYRSAEAGASAIPLRYRHGVLLMGRVYRREGWRAALGFRSRPGRVSVPVWERVLLGLEVAGLALTPRIMGLVPPARHDRKLHRAFLGRPGSEAIMRSRGGRGAEAADDSPSERGSGWLPRLGEVRRTW